MLKKLYPPFLKKYDHYLLTHYPVVWKSRIHVFGFFSLILGNLLALLLGYLIPMSKTNVVTVTDYNGLELFTTIFLLFMVIGYIILQRRFPLDQVSVLKRVAIIPLYVLCFTSVIMNVSVFQDTLVSRIANIVPDDEFDKDHGLALQLQNYRNNLDNFGQNNLNALIIMNLGEAYGFQGIETNITGDFNNKPSAEYQNIQNAHQLERVIGSIGAAKYYRDNYDLSGFLNSYEYATSNTEYLIPISSFATQRGSFWNVSIFMIGFFSLLTFLATFFEGKSVLGFLFGLFLFWFVSIIGMEVFGLKGLFGGSLMPIVALVFAVIPFLWRSKTMLSKWISGFVMILLFIVGYSIYFMGYESEFYSHSLVQILVMESLFAILLVYILFLLKKELLPQRIK